MADSGDGCQDMEAQADGEPEGCEYEAEADLFISRITEDHSALRQLCDCVDTASRAISSRTPPQTWKFARM